jgi:hypothetical protein
MENAHTYRSRDEPRIIPMCRIVVPSVEYPDGILAFFVKVAEEFTETRLILFLQFRSGRHIDKSSAVIMRVGENGMVAERLARILYGTLFPLSQLTRPERVFCHRRESARQGYSSTSERTRTIVTL